MCGKGHVRTVYSQMNEKVTGEVLTNHVKKQKSKATRERKKQFEQKSGFL